VSSISRNRGNNREFSLEKARILEFPANSAKFQKRTAEEQGISREFSAVF
jgi:hypothetical protein